MKKILRKLNLIWICFILIVDLELAFHSYNDKNKSLFISSLLLVVMLAILALHYYKEIKLSEKAEDIEEKLKKPLDNSERLAVNAALTKLTDGWDEESAKTVIQYCRRLPRISRWAIESYSRRKNDGNIVSGHTDEFGDVQIKTSGETTVKEHSFGIPKERVGYFKVYRCGINSIGFHHFWRSDISTSLDIESRPPEYLLGYESTTLKPLFFAVWEVKVRLFIIPLTSFAIEIYDFSLIPIYGKTPKCSKKGFSIAKINL